MDKIFINKLQFYGYHGVYPEETKLGQRFYVDVIIEADLKSASQSDDINDTIDYSLVYGRIRHIMEGEPRKLLEKLAEEIATDLLQNFSLVERITIKIVKPNPPIHGHYDSVAVEITRGR
ncbi:dihydroneopterin aldolase [Pueribacillus sp. YX66]|uniref:dihydroneopterin aldolase n=1 Tax=Pueribacillus sp. YX66 TaxID=3229242 RepID=UPI00358D42CF